MTTLEDFEARLADLIAEFRQVSATPFAATDAAGNPAGVAAGELIESAWGNAVKGRVVRRFPDKTAALADPDGEIGQLVVTTGDNRVWLKSAAGVVTMLGWGGRVVTPATDAGGHVNVPHGLGSLPAWCAVTPVADAGYPASVFARSVVLGMSTTYVSFEVYDVRTAALLGSNPIVVYLAVGGV